MTHQRVLTFTSLLSIVLFSLHWADEIARGIESGTLDFVVCDYGWKYLSTGAWTLDLDEATANAEKVIYF